MRPRRQHRRLSHLLAITLVALLGAGVRADEDSPEIPRAAWTGLDNTAKALASGARGGELDELLDVMIALGRPPKDIDKLRKRTAKSLKRGKRKASNDTRAAKALAKATAALTPVLSTLKDEARTRFALLLLKLDDRMVPAHEAAGHVKREGVAGQEGTWVPAWMTALLDRRVKIEQAVRDARGLEVLIETGASRHTMLQALYGKTGFKATWGKISIHSVKLGAARLERILRQSLRACALSSFLRGGPLAIPAPRQPYVGINLGSIADYKRAVGIAHKSGGFSDADALSYRDQGWFLHEKERYVVAGFQTEAAIEASLFGDQLWETTFESAQPCLQVGHMNWVCQTILGTWAPSWSYDDSKGKKDAASQTGSPADRAERLEAELVAEAGLAGSRAFLRYLVRHREDPPYTDAMHTQIGKIGGVSRLKATVVAAFLHELDLLKHLATETRAVEREIPAAFTKALGMSMQAFEARWRAWLLPLDASIARRLITPAQTAASMPAPTRKMLTYLDDLRERAWFGPQGVDMPPLTLDPELTNGCRLHAVYLDKNPEQKVVWPAAHEEYPDKKGFSPAGSLGGLNSVIAFGDESASAFVDGWLGTFYHRLPLLEPGLRRIGWAHAARVAVLDCGSMVAPATAPMHVRWPYENQAGVPRSFQPELPNPVPGEDQSAWGYPITLQILRQKEDAAPIEMALYRGSVKPANRVPCHFSTPDKPTNPELAPAETWCLIPKQTLAPKQRYFVVVKGRAEAPNWTWGFTTGS